MTNARAEEDAGARQRDDINKQVTFKNWERFTDCVSETIIRKWIMQKILM